MRTQENDTVYDAGQLRTSAVIATRPATLQSFVAVNGGSSLRWLQFFDAVAVPADATAPSICPIPIEPNTAVSIDMPDGMKFATGISWASSSTLATKTITGAADLWVTANWE